MSTDIEPNSDTESASRVIDPELASLVSEWQYSQIRFQRLLANPALRREALIIIGLLALVFVGPYYGWVRRWMLPGSLQTYAIFVFPLVFAWLWIARYWLATPEVGPLRKAIQEEKQTRWMPKQPGERELTVIRVLVEGAPVIDKRYGFLLVFAILVDAVAFWFEDPTLLCIGFIFTCAGIILFRFGAFALRTAVFPLLFMFAMVPFPGPFHDALSERLEPMCFSPAEHMMINLKVKASLAPEGNPLTLTVKGQPYRVFAEKVGLCIPESTLVILILIMYLSLVRTRKPLLKLGPILCTLLLTGVMAELRLILVCYVATIDRDVSAFLEPLTRLMVPVLGIGVAYLTMRGFQCIKLHRWVSFSLKP